MFPDLPPVASTSAAADLSGSGDLGGGAGTKRKRLPACDSCKLRRLKCNPVPPPGSCERCRTTGVVCTTTPTVRKKAPPRTGKRIEEAKATFGTADPDAGAGFMGPSNSPWVGRTKDGATTLATGIRAPELSEMGTENRIAGREMDGAIVAHLLELYSAIPQSWLPIGVRGRTLSQFEAAGRRLEALPPQTEVLARITIALTSRLSSHPALFGSSPTHSTPIPSLSDLTPAFLASHPDLRQFGLRREAACEALHAHAVEMAWERGTLVQTCEESLASCYLLEMLEGRGDPTKGKPYGSAFVSHLQTILNGQDQPGARMKVVNMSLGWSALIMREALHAANSGRTSHFTATDDLLLCGEVPVSVEEALLETVDDVDLRDSITLFFRPMRPYTYHCARLARECSEQLTGTFARRQPFNELYLTKYLTALDHLLHLFAVLEARIAFVLSPAATAAHSLPAPFETERQFIMRACLYTLSLAWSSLSLPVYSELSRRIADLRQPPPAALPSHALADRKRLLERLILLQSQVHSTVLKGARMVAQCVHEAPSLAFLTHLQSENLEKWVQVLREARTVEEGGEGITAEEKESDLRWMLDGLKTMGWSWTDNGPLISSLEASLGEMSLEDDPSAAFPSLSHEHDYDPPTLDLPTPAPLFASFAELGAGESPFSVSAELPHPPQPTSAAYEVPPFLSGAAPQPPASTSSAPHPPSTAQQPPSSTPSAMPDLSSLSSLFSGVPPPSSSSAPSSAAPVSAGIGGPPDLPTLISLYSSGALDAPIAQHGLDVNQLAGQFLSGTLDLGALWAGMGRDLDGASAEGEAAPGDEPGPAPVQGQGPAGAFDIEALLAEPLFGASSAAGGGAGAGEGRE
ncbi:hypothetical protein JCM8097_008389 [Rhodosporidiobolus ruineniae]